MVIAQVARTRTLATVSDKAFTVGALVLSTWLVLGMYVDAWAHHHLFFETFFTPWHALLYTGAVANGVFLGVLWLRNSRTLPAGYELSLVGCILFGFGGFCDLIWHSLFGIERNFAAILSPTHLLLMLSAGLIVTGAFRAAWHSKTAVLPFSAAWSLALATAVVCFFMQDLHPLTAEWANPRWVFDHAGLAASFVDGQNLPRFSDSALQITEMLGIVDMVLATAVIVGTLLTTLGRFELQLGQVGLLIAFPMSAIVFTYKLDPIVLIAVLAGVLGEVLRLILRPVPSRPVQLRAFIVLVIGFLWGLYMWGLATTEGVFWPIHSEFGVVVVSAVTAWLLTYLAYPPRTMPRSSG